jgi:hypothetical protein
MENCCTDTQHSKTVMLAGRPVPFPMKIKVTGHVLFDATKVYYF